MNHTKKLPGMRSGSTARLLAVGSLYVFVSLCTLLVIIGAVIGSSDDDEPEIAEVTPTVEPETTPVTDTPEITDELIDDAVAFIEDEPGVNDATISVSDDTVTMAVIIGHATTEDTAQDILDSFVRYLASQAAIRYDIDSPSSDNLGELWDHYTLQVGAGPSPDEFYARGAKARSSSEISWD